MFRLGISKKWTTGPFGLLPLVTLALLAPGVSESCFAQTLRVFQAEYSGYTTGIPYTERTAQGPISGIYAGWNQHPPGLIHYSGLVSGLPANQNLTAKFRLAAVSTSRNPNDKLVALEVYSETRQMTLINRVVRNDVVPYYVDHELGFRLMPREVVSLRAYFFGSTGSQTKIDLSSIGK